MRCSEIVPAGPEKPRVDLLLIDDCLSDLRLLIEMLAQRNLSVSIALDGDRGCRQAALLLPRLILLDVRLPGANGFSVCRALKKQRITEHIPVIFLTAANNLDERLEGFSAGGVDYIAKPFEIEEVLARINVHLSIKSEVIGDFNRAIPSGSETEEIKDRDQILVMIAQGILKEAIASPPELEVLAGIMGVNRRRLNEAFQAILGQPVFGWLREERLKQAYLLVSQTVTPFGIIGETLGYSNAANFSKAFRARYGFTPGEVRAATTKQRSDASDGMGPD